jgi:hypothetical protein
MKNEGGTLIYEVPINRVHCTTGFLGTVDCQDTGESVTMRIVANPTKATPVPPMAERKESSLCIPLPEAAELSKWGPAGP